MKFFSSLIFILFFVSNIFSQPLRNWGTYYGGTLEDNAKSVAVDASGNVYITGITLSTAGISTPGSHQPAHGGGTYDAYLVKFNSAGVRQWGTYFGGDGAEEGYSVAVDNSGNVYIAGIGEFISVAISTAGSHQPTHGAGFSDAFLAKFNTSGVLQWATYYGGTGFEAVSNVTTDVSGNVYLAGSTTSSTNISTAGSHQPAFAGGADEDGYLVKFNSAGVRQWATYYGGSDDDEIQSMVVDASGNVYAAGSTVSPNAISTAGSHQTALGGFRDGLLVKFNSAGVRQWGSYYGGFQNDGFYSIAMDVNGDIYSAGFSQSSSSISTVGSHQPVHGGSDDGILIKFNTSGVRQWATYYGGTLADIIYSVTTDAGGNMYVAGRTFSSTSISTPGSHQPVFAAGGNNDAFLTKFNNSGIRQWGTYYGATGDEEGRGIAVDINGLIYLAGHTTSSTAITTAGSHQPTKTGGPYDAFLVQFNGCTLLTQPGSISGSTSVCSGTSNTYSVTNDAGATSYTWTLPGGWSGTSTTNSITTTAGSTGGTIEVTANNACGSSTMQTLSVTVNTIPATPGSISGTTTICSGSSNTYSVTAVAGATSYTWTLPGGWTGTSTTNSINTTASSTNGNITATANNICGNSSAQTLAVTVNTAPLTPGSIAGNTTVCSGTSQTYAVTPVAGATSYAWNLPAGWSGTSITNSINVTTGLAGGSLTVMAGNSCGNSAVQSVTVSVNTVPAQPSSITGSVTVCEGISQNYSVTNDVTATSYTWTLPATWSGSSASNSITATAGSGSGQVVVSANNSCGNSTSQTLNVVVNPLPTVTLSLNATSVCVDNAVFTFSGGSPAGGIFSGIGVTGGNFNATTAGVGTHTITYTFTDANSCTNSNTDQITVNNCTDILNNEISHIEIYPNPFINEITIDGNFSGTIEIAILNSLGEVVHAANITANLNPDSYRIQTSNFPSGLYFLVLNNGNATTIKKIVKQ